VHLQEARAGDRYLLCSDGLCAVVPDERIRAAVARAGTDPEEVVTDLITLCHDRGAPDRRLRGGGRDGDSVTTVAGASVPWVRSPGSRHLGPVTRIPASVPGRRSRGLNTGVARVR
jgi:hypothetical protein